MMSMKVLLALTCSFFSLPGPVGAQMKIDLGGGDGGLGGLGDLLSGLAGAAKQKKDGSCPSHCEELHPDSHHAVSPAPKERIRPYSNGCSVPESMRAGLGDYSAFDPCCDLHDSCYMSCGVPKQFCEKEFGKCMKQQCKNKYKNAGDLQECNGKADLFMTGTTLFGCGGYVELQRDGCDCLSHDEAAKRIHQYAREFYEVYNQTHPLPQKVIDAFLEHEDHVHPRKRTEKHGMLLYRLYKKYPHSIDVVGNRDGKSGRPEPVFFDIPRKSKQKSAAADADSGPGTCSEVPPEASDTEEREEHAADDADKSEGYDADKSETSAPPAKEDSDCGSCYGAGDPDECCTCDQVRYRYKQKNWKAEKDDFAQCRREHAAPPAEEGSDCGSCYGVGDPNECCTCDEVMSRYKEKKWKAKRNDFAQCLLNK